MAYKKIPINRIRINRTYTIAELAAALDVCPVTVWNWIQDGLPTVDRTKKPWLIDGRQAKSYLEERTKRNKKKMKYYELYRMNIEYG